MMRIRINFSKTEIIKYTSHLDLYRAWERTLRRAELPLAYSKGFKPHPHINLACALPLGFTSENDLVDIWLEQDIYLEEISRRLIKAAPPGIEIKSVFEIPIQTSSLQKQLKACEYLVTLLEKASDLPDKLAELLASESLWRERNDKKYDLRGAMEKLPPGAAVLLAFDNDGPGEKLAEEIKAIAPVGRDVRRVLPDVGKDWNEALKHRLGLS